MKKIKKKTNGSLSCLCGKKGRIKIPVGRRFVWICSRTCSIGNDGAELARQISQREDAEQWRIMPPGEDAVHAVNFKTGVCVALKRDMSPDESVFYSSAFMVVSFGRSFDAALVNMTAEIDSKGEALAELVGDE